MSAKFIHLHTHSEYSLLDGLSKIKLLVAKAKELDMSAVALTDHGVMYGAIEFYKECVKEGVKPLIGMEGYVVNKDHKIKEGKGENNHVVLIATNHEGYKNLMTIATIAHVEGYYYRPRISKEVLRQYTSGLIALSSCPKGEIGQLITAGNVSAATEVAAWYSEVFGPGRYFLPPLAHRCTGSSVRRETVWPPSVRLTL